MQKISTFSLFILLVFCSTLVVGQNSQWVTTDAGTQLEVFPASTDLDQKTPLKSGASATAVSNTLTTLFASDNTFAGNMFDVEVLGSLPIIINALDINIRTYNSSTCTIRVYYKEGTYAGSNNSSANWTLASEVTGVVPQGANNATHISTENIILNPGTTYGFYVTISDYPSAEMLYTNGSNVYSNADIKITTGIGKGDPDFSGSNFNSRIWNGTIYYTEGELVPFSMWSVVAFFLLISLTLLYRFRKKILA